MANITTVNDKAFSEDGNRKMWGLPNDVQMEYEFFFTPEPNYKGLEIYVEVDAEDSNGNNIGAEVVEFILSSNIYGGDLWSENDEEYLWENISNPNDAEEVERVNNSDLFKIKYTTDWKVFPQGYELVGDEIFLFRVKFKKETARCTDIRVDVHAKPVTLMEVYEFTANLSVDSSRTIDMELPSSAFHEITNIQLVGVSEGDVSIKVKYVSWEKVRDTSHFLIYSPPITIDVVGSGEENENNIEKTVKLSFLIAGY